MKLFGVHKRRWLNFLAWIGLSFPSISKIYSSHLSYSRIQYVQNLHILPRMARYITPNFYNLDAVISVGYRVNSLQATRFRQWATKILNEYIKKGFILNDDRLKQGETVFGQDYFQELLERIRSIRASERRIWQKITDILCRV